MSGKIVVERTEYVATVIIDNVAKRNALSQAMWIAMGDAILDLSSDPALRCIVLRGAGHQAFGSGADIDEFETIRSTKEQGISFAHHGHRAMNAVRDCPVPTLAAIRGICVGGGLELAANCDLRIATPESRFGVPIAKLGAVLAHQELEGLLRLAGTNVALELLLEGRLFDAAEALSKGMLNRVVATEQFEDALTVTIDRIIAGAPLSARWHKRFVEQLRYTRCADLPPDVLDEGFACYDTADFVIGYQAFLAKQSPIFKGK